MTRYMFEQRAAYDPISGTLLYEALAQFFALDDTDMANPLTVYDSAGVAYTTLRTGTDVPAFPDFFVDDPQQGKVRWKSGSFTGILVSYDYILNIAGNTYSTVQTANQQLTAQAAASATAAQQAAASNYQGQYRGTVASQTLMLGLAAKQGDWCIRSDVQARFDLTGTSPKALTSWTQNPAGTPGGGGGATSYDDLGNLPFSSFRSGMSFYVGYDGTSWRLGNPTTGTVITSRPTTRTDVIMIAVNIVNDAVPPFAINGLDLLMVVPG